MSEKFNHPWHKFYPEKVSLSLDYPSKPLPELLADIAKEYGDTDAYIFAGKNVTYREFNEQVRKFATALDRLGVKKGDRVALMAPNCPHFVISYFAIMIIGAIVVQTNPMYTAREVGYLLKDSGAEVMVVYDALYPYVKEAQDDTNLQKVIVFNLEEANPFEGDQIYSFEKLLSETPSNPPAVQINLTEDLAVFQYTGGTTGVSKGAMLTHFNLVSNAYATMRWLHDVTKGKERNLVILPLFHSFGMTVNMNSNILMAGTMVLVPRFEPQEVLDLIKAYRPTFFHGVPTMYTALLGHPNLEKYDLSSIRACISGGAPMPMEIMQQFQEVTGAKILEGYGLSESSPSTHCNPLGGTVKIGSVGIPFPDTDCKVVDIATGEKELGVGEEGEIIIKGPQIMKGYWNMDEETASTLRNGWLYTGDIGKMDEDGYFYIVDRKKEMIIAGGYNIYPREVEEVLYEIPGIAEVAVTGVPHKYRGETVWAFVVAKQGAGLTEENIIEYCRKKMASYKVPRKVKFLEGIPKSGVGKILRRKLSELSTIENKN